MQKYRTGGRTRSHRELTAEGRVRGGGGRGGEVARAQAPSWEAKLTASIPVLISFLSSPAPWTWWRCCWRHICFWRCCRSKLSRSYPTAARHYPTAFRHSARSSLAHRRARCATACRCTSAPCTGTRRSRSWWRSAATRAPWCCPACRGVMASVPSACSTAGVRSARAQRARRARRALRARRARRSRRRRRPCLARCSSAPRPALRTRGRCGASCSSATTCQTRACASCRHGGCSRTCRSL